MINLPLHIVKEILSFVPCQTIHDLLTDGIISLNLLNMDNYENCHCNKKNRRGSGVFGNDGNYGWKCLNGKFIRLNTFNTSLQCVLKKEKHKTRNGIFNIANISKIAAHYADI